MQRVITDTLGSGTPTSELPMMWRVRSIHQALVWFSTCPCEHEPRPPPGSAGCADGITKSSVSGHHASPQHCCDSIRYEQGFLAVIDSRLLRPRMKTSRIHVGGGGGGGGGDFIGNGGQDAIEGALPVCGDDDKLVANLVHIAHFALQQNAPLPWSQPKMVARLRPGPLSLPSKLHLTFDSINAERLHHKRQAEKLSPAPGGSTSLPPAPHQSRIAPLRRSLTRRCAQTRVPQEAELSLETLA